MKFYYHTFKVKQLSIYSIKTFLADNIIWKILNNMLYSEKLKKCVCKYVYTQVLVKVIFMSGNYIIVIMKNNFIIKDPDFSIESSYFLQENSINWFYHFPLLFFTSLFSHQQLSASFFGKSMHIFKIKFYMPIYYFKLYVLLLI